MAQSTAPTYNSTFWKSAQCLDYDSLPEQPYFYCDSVAYDHASMRYGTVYQESEIKELKKKLEEKELKKERDIKNLIAYYYKQ